VGSWGGMWQRLTGGARDPGGCGFVSLEVELVEERCGVVSPSLSLPPRGAAG